MNEWQQHFLQKVDLLQGASRDQFEQASDQIITPLFEEFRQFTSQQSLCATVPMAKPGIRSFKFALTENTYLLITFRLAGFDHCEAQSEFFVPGHQKITSTPTHVELPELDANWARTIFEQSLDRFIDSYVQSLGPNGQELFEPHNQLNQAPTTVPANATGH